MSDRKLFAYIWEIEPDSPLVGRWQYSDGEHSAGGATTLEMAMAQVYRIATTKHANVIEIRLSLAQVDEESIAKSPPEA